MSFSIQQAQIGDLQAIHHMMLELAQHVYGPGSNIRMSLGQLKRDFSREQPAFSALVVKKGEVTIGYALYCFMYLSWSGEFLYLDDLYIQPKHRGSGIGKELISKLAEIAKMRDCAGMEWYVQDHNERAIKFYHSLGVKTLNDTSIFRCKQLDKLSSKP